jgi:hypothetical protein
MMTLRCDPDSSRIKIMQARLSLTLALSSLLLAACSSSSNSDRATATPPANNNNGSPVNGVLTARFDPTTSTIPLPNNLLLSGTTDLTLNPPVANPNNFGDPTVAISTLDGWSTSAPMSTAFNAKPDVASLLPGQSIRIFEVSLTGPGGGVTGVSRELAGGTEFVAALAPSDPTGRTLAIVPTAPLKQLTSYLVVLTDRIRDANGNDATPDQTYFLSKRPTPLCVGGVSQEPLLPNATACALEPLRQLTNSHLRPPRSPQGMARDDVVVSWVFTTQASRRCCRRCVPVTEPGRPASPNSGQTIAVAGLPPIADIYIGTINLPYYLTAPVGTPANPPTGPLTGFWRAAPGAYVPRSTRLGLDPTSTNITFANPFPVATGHVTVPVLMTVPNAASGLTRPAAGWPVVIFQHGITRNRTDALAIAGDRWRSRFRGRRDRPAAAWCAPDPHLAILAVRSTSSGTPFAPLARERTFDVDYVNNDHRRSGPMARSTTPVRTHQPRQPADLARQPAPGGGRPVRARRVRSRRMDIDGNQAPVTSTSKHRVRRPVAGQHRRHLVPRARAERQCRRALSVPGGGRSRSARRFADLRPAHPRRHSPPAVSPRPIRATVASSCW